jgi:hypothetical protein
MTAMTLIPITIDDANSASKAMLSYNDGTNNAFAHVILDQTTGLPVSPANSGNQATANTALVAIQNSVAGTLAVSGTVAVAGSALPSGAATAANQATGNTSLTAIATSVAAATPAGTNIIGKVGIDQTTPGTTNGVQVNAALPAGANIIGAVTPPGTVHLTAAPTVTAGAYTTGMVVGGLIPLAGAARVNNGSGLLQNVVVTVKTALTAAFDVLVFDTQPTNSTFTDNVALALNVADLPSLCGVAHCTDLISGGTPQILQMANGPLAFKLSAASTTLYAVIVMRGAETLASTSAIGLSAIILQD